jgi:hypothetical protein
VWGGGRVEAEVLVRGLAVVGGSGCVAVLVDESAAGGVSSDRSAGPILDDCCWASGWSLVEAAVGSVRVVMLDVVA